MPGTGRGAVARLEGGDDQAQGRLRRPLLPRRLVEEDLGDLLLAGRRHARPRLLQLLDLRAVDLQVDLRLLATMETVGDPRLDDLQLGVIFSFTFPAFKQGVAK